MSEKVFFMGQELLEDAPSEGTYLGCVSMDVSGVELLKFFNNALTMASFLRDLKSSDDFSVGYLCNFAYDSYERLFKDSGILDKFEYFYSCCKEIEKDGKKS